MVYYKECNLQTHKREHWVDITESVRSIVSESNILNGILSVSSLHTTAGITLNENADPDVGRDFFWKLGCLVPQEEAYRHSEGNSDSHLKASLVGLSVSVPIRNGAFVFGTWQSIYFCEFDGPRHRKVSVTIVGE